jgi:cystathionine beta-lyase
LEATYLPWVDVTAIGKPAAEIEEVLKSQWGVWVNSGDMYGVDGFVRINIATSRALLSEGLSRVISGLKSML